MARGFGDLRASFWDLDNIPVGGPVSVGGSTIFTDIVPDSVEGFRAASQIGSGRVLLYNTTHATQFAAPGRICVVEQAVTGYAETFSRLMAMFIIETVEPFTDSNGMNVIALSGPGVEHFLTRYPVFDPVGDETIIETTLAENAPGPASKSLAVTPAPWVNIVTLNNIDNIEVGDEMRIDPGGGQWTVHEIIALEPGEVANTVQFVPAIQTGYESGNTVHIRRKNIVVADVAGMGANQKAILTLNDDSTLETRIVEVDEGEKIITLADGLPGAANSGKAFDVYDYARPSTSDVTQVMQHAGDWGATFQTGNGTAAGTAHVPQGESVFDILLSIAERTGEFFRYRVLASNVPTYSIEWRRTPDSSGVTLKMYHPHDHDEQLADETSLTVGEIRHMRQKSSVGLVTRIYPSSGNQKVSLRYCSNDALSYALTKGCYVTLSDDVFEPDSVTFSAGVSAHGVLAMRETYGDIALDEDATFSELQAASDQLLLSAVQSLLAAHSRVYYTVEGYVPVALKPGQTVKIRNTTNARPYNDGTTNYAILDVTERMQNGRPYTILTVSDTMGLKRTAANSFGMTMRSVTQSVRRLEGRGGSAGGRNTTVIINQPGGGGEEGDHTHSQYVPIVGGVTVTGNIGAASGVTFDGVDLSAHAVDQDAHHAAVTLANDGLTLDGQAVGLRVPAGSGLSITAAGVGLLLDAPSGLQKGLGGLSIADTLAGDGLQMTNKIMRVGLASPSGLVMTGGLLRLGTPLQISATSVGSVTAEGHTHTVAASSNPGAASWLLKTTGEGYLQLFSLGVGASPDGASGLIVMAPQPHWHALKIKQRAGQTAHMLRIENSAGNALILLTNDGDLESGNPGFVSGHTGWQVSHEGDAEFNNLRVRGELHATTFVADEMHATGGTMLLATATTVGKPYVFYNNVLKPIAPHSGATITYIVVNASWATGLCYFSAKDIVRIKSMGEVVSGGSLYIPDIYLEVFDVIALNDRNLAQGNPGRHVLACYRKSGGQTGYEVPAGSAVVKWTKSGQGAGAYTGGMLLTSDLQYGPYIDVYTVDASRTNFTQWPGSGETRTPPTIKPRVRLGNLDGVLGLPEQWGMAAGTDLSDTSASARYLVLSDLMQQSQNIDSEYYNNGQRIIRLSTEGITLLASAATYDKSRALRWELAGGTVVGVVAASGDGVHSRMEMGVSPLFNAISVTENGMEIVHRPGTPVGSAEHWVELKSWGDIHIQAGREVRATNLRVITGLLIGSQSGVIPPDGVLRLAARPNSSIFPNSTQADLFTMTDGGGVQRLLVKFGNGVVRQLAIS